MRGTQVVAGLAMLTIIGALASYPVRANAEPQLAVAATGAGMAPQINNGFLSGARRAVDTAKDDKKKADARAGDLNGLMDDEERSKGPDLSGLAGKVYTASEMVKMVTADGAQKHAGALVKADGVILKVIAKPDHTLVYLGAPKNTDKSPVFAFRLPAGKQFEEGSKAVLEGSFVTRMAVEGFPQDLYLVNGTGFDGAAGATAGAAIEPKAPFDGWKFVGSVEADGGATGVFVKEGKTLYAQPGDHLSDDVEIVRLKAGEAVIRDGKATSVLSPW